MNRIKLDHAIAMAIASGEAWDTAEFDAVDISNVQFSANFYKKRDAIIRKYSNHRSLNVIKKILIIAATVVLSVLTTGLLTVVAIEPLRENAQAVISEWLEPKTEETTMNKPQIPPPGISYSSGLAFALSDDETYYTVTGIGSCTDNVIYVPPTYNDLPVKVIGERAFKPCMADNIFIPEGVERIEKQAFWGCKALYIQLPESLTYIGERAFDFCGDIETIHLSDNITFIGADAFNYCYNLKNVTLPSSLTSIEQGTFENCFRITEIVIPDNVTYIGQSAFSNCRSLKSVTFGKSVTTIGQSAFRSCAELESVTFSDGVEVIENGAFAMCDKLSSVSFGNRLRSIGNAAFGFCVQLDSIVVPESVEYLGSDVFIDCTSLKSVDLSKSRITAIKERTFSGCSNLVSISLPEGITEIGNIAFSECRALERISFPDGIESFGDHFIYYCTNLKEISIGSGVKKIGMLVPESTPQLTLIIFGGSEEEWNNVEFANKIYYSNITVRFEDHNQETEGTEEQET